jgi:CRISPR-associated endonuclease/helicase Cas3
LLDAAAVGELLWDRFFAPALCDRLDAATDGGGRRLFAWLCAFHDVGKATPAFQGQVDGLAQRVRDAGLACHGLGPYPARKWRHERASAWVLLQVTTAAGWAEESQAWVWPLVAGHHGVFPSRGDVRPPRRNLHGREVEWTQVQQALADVAALAAGYSDLTEAEPSSQPARAVQLALSGLVIMADWIASDEHHFPGVDDWTQVTPQHARERAARAWDALGLHRGWGRLSTVPSDPIAERFAVQPRASQRAVVQAAQAMPEPGLLVLEAPTGEGKTEAALAAAEVLAARFGDDGVFVGMPTQATSDPMLRRVGTWATHIEAGMQIALLHGKRRFNPEWQALLERRPSHPQHSASGEPVDEHGVRDDFGTGAVVPADVDHGGDSQEALAAVQDWLLGPKRGLLAPTAVGTIDQLLFAATRTKHVALRFAGLAGKVVVLDEVHAIDIYMQ